MNTYLPHSSVPLYYSDSVLKGVDKGQLASDLKWLISELKVRQRDVGFSGEPETVVHYASLLLGENLVTR